MTELPSNSRSARPRAESGELTYWRVEGSLLEVGALRPVGFFTWNAQSFAERWARRAGRDGVVPAVRVRRKPHLRHAVSAHAAARRQPRPPRSAGRRVFSVRAQTPASPGSGRKTYRSG